MRWSDVPPAAVEDSPPIHPLLVQLIPTPPMLFRLPGLFRVALLPFLAATCLPSPLVAQQPVTTAEEELHPPIPVRFTMPEPGLVTLVLEDSEGRRVRNLIAETPFQKGEHTVWWDGADESRGVARDPDGIFRTQGKLVQPGNYRVRGLWHKGIDLFYEFSVYTAGKPPWKTADNKGRWLADHTPPTDVLFLPAKNDRPAQMLITSFVAEGGDGLVFTDLQGKKERGLRWVGGAWTGALYAARDAGATADPEVLAYTVSSWPIGSNQNQDAAELRFVALTEKGDRPVVAHSFARANVPPPRANMHGNDSDKRYVAGLAAHEGLLVASLDRHQLLAFVDAKGGKTPVFASVEGPRGVAFDRDGKLLVLSGTKLLRYSIDKAAILALARPAEPKRNNELAAGDSQPPHLASQTALPHPETIIAAALEDPRQITVDPAGHLYISDWGTSHQVKVFSADGRLLRTIGAGGAPGARVYNPAQMQHPNGIAITEDGQLWVAEADYAPKRISVWSADGALVRAFYGPPHYGGGGSIDHRDRSRFYYCDEKFPAAMEFKLDWEIGTDQLVSVFWRPGPDDVRMPANGPQTPIYHGGHQYMTNMFVAHPTNSPSVVGLWIMRDGLARPVATIGDAYAWEELRRPELQAAIPAGVDLAEERRDRQEKHPLLFAWSDKNSDARVQADELTFSKLAEPRAGMLFLKPDFSITTTYGRALKPRSFTDKGVPLYDAADATIQTPINDVKWSSGARVLLEGQSGWQILTGDPLRGYKDGALQWTYPNAWPSLHSGHDAPPQQYSGQLIATTKPLSWPFTPRGSEVEMWAYNGDRGNAYLLSSDGLFISQLFRDGHGAKDAKTWDSLPAERGMKLTERTKHGEDFWPTLNQTADGKVYLVAGKEHSSIVRLEGLGSVKRFDVGEVKVTPELLTKVGEYVVQRDALRQKEQGTSVMKVRSLSPTVDGKLEEWASADWVKIDETTFGAIAVDGERLYAAYRVQDRDLLQNTGESLPMLFKTGGALDLMLATDPGAPSGRKQPIAGDLRLLVSRVKDKPVAVLYSPVSPGIGNPVPFSSPWRTVHFDRVEDLSTQVQLASDKRREEIIEKKKPRTISWEEYEFSIPLSALAFRPEAGKRISGDIGILRGQAGETQQRVYWHNKATGLMNDVPGEAMLAPALWGSLELVSP